MRNGADERDARGFLAVGLGDLEARVLVTVLAEEEVTAATLCAVTGASGPAVSVAVRSLVRCGLLERVTNRRPSLVFLHPNAPEALALLIAAAQEEHQQLLAQVDQAIDDVTRASARREERGRPYYESEPPPRGAEPVSSWRERRGRTAHNEVLCGTDGAYETASRSLLRCPARLLFARTEVDLQLVASRQQPGSEVRATKEALPTVRLLDGQRVGITASSKQGAVLVWSRDELHVRAASELFALWWGRAAPGIITPYPEATPEEDLEVDEWDAAEL